MSNDNERPYVEIVIIDDGDGDYDPEGCYVRIKTSRDTHFNKRNELMYDYISDYRMVFGEYDCVLDLELEKDKWGYTDFSKITNIKKYKRPLSELTSTDIKDITDSYESWLKNRDGTLTCGFDYFKVPLLKVKSVVPHEIYDELWSTEKLSEETVKKL